MNTFWFEINIISSLNVMIRQNCSLKIDNFVTAATYFPLLIGGCICGRGFDWLRVGLSQSRLGIELDRLT